MSVEPATDAQVAWHKDMAADDHQQRWTQPEVASLIARIEADRVVIEGLRQQLFLETAEHMRSLLDAH